MPKLAKVLKPLEVSRLKDRGNGQYPVGAPAGLMLKVDGASQSWVLRTMVAGRRRSIGLGAYPGVSLADARTKAQAKRDRIREGADPIRERAAAVATARAASANALTFEAAAAQYIEANRAAWRNTKHGDQWERTLSSWAYPIIGSLLVENVQTAHVLQVLRQPVADEGQFWTVRTETASRVRQRIEAVIAAADASAGRDRLNPARREIVQRALPKASKVKKVQHHAALPWQQVPRLMVELSDQEGIAARALAWTILTACRSGEVRGMTWRELDLNGRTWTIPSERMKASRPHRVPLTDEMMTLLPQRGDPDDLVFAGAHGGNMSDMTMPAVLKRMGVTGVTVHGFRSSFRDWAGEATHHPREVIEHALAHQLGSKAEQAYARGDLFAKRHVLMNHWSEFCTSGNNSDTVVQLPTVRPK
jgi:integrase